MLLAFMSIRFLYLVREKKTFEENFCEEQIMSHYVISIYQQKRSLPRFNMSPFRNITTS